MARMTVDELASSLNQDLYTPRTDEELQSAAEKKYQTIYNQQKQTAQQRYETTDLAYKNQLKALEDTLAQDQMALAKSTADSIASQNRYMTTRGMQRSSYGAANQARIQSVGQNNLTALLKQYATDAAGIESNRTLLAQQLADSLAQYDIDYLNDVQAYIEDQKQIDYEREQAALKNQNDVLMALFEYSQKYGNIGGGGGGSGYKKSSGSGSSNKSSSSGSLATLERDAAVARADAQKAAIDAARAAAVASQRANANVKTTKTSTTQDGSKYSF